MKKIIIFLSMLLLLVNVCYATYFDISSTPVKDNLIRSGEAVFDINIKNNQDFTDTVTYVLSDLSWDWEKQFFTLGQNGQVNFEFKLKTPANIVPGVYNLQLKVYSQNNPEVYDYESLIVKVLDYDELIEIEELSEGLPQGGLDPRKENLVKLNLKNLNNLELKNLNVKLESEIFNKEFVFDMSPLASRTEEFYLDINDNNKEGNYDVKILATLNGKILLDRTDNVLVSFYSDIQENKEEKSGFLTNKLIITRENKGNIDSSEEYKLSVSSFERTFTKTSPKPSSIEKKEGAYQYIWNFRLGPGESYRIVVSTNYRDPILFLILFGFIVYLLCTILQSGISLKKRVLTLKTGAGVSDMKVLLIIKNKGHKPIKDVKVMDTLPRVVKLPEDYGTVEPTQIKKNFGGNTVLIWKLGNLIGKEERVVSYRMKTGISVLGKFGVHKAVCVYRKGNRSMMVKSNSNFVFS